MSVHAAKPSRSTSTRKVCLYCGFGGLTIQAGGDLTHFRCPACRGDLYARPPRSYLEMEGFVDPTPAGRVKVRGWRGALLAAVRVWNRVRGWLWRGSPAEAMAALPLPRPTVRGRASRIHEQRGTRRRQSESKDE